MATVIAAAAAIVTTATPKAIAMFTAVATVIASTAAATIVTAILQLLESLALVHSQVHYVQHAVLQLDPAVADRHHWKSMERYYRHFLATSPAYCRTHKVFIGL